MENHLIFTSAFDSGNLAKVEAVPAPIPQLRVTHSAPTFNNCSGANGTSNSGQVDFEYRLWTSADCEGTQYQNANRTWFHFAVKNYKPNQVARFTLMNMNRQSRLYSQGYAPLYRTVHDSLIQSKWLRVKEKPSWETTDNQFRLTFIHKFNEPYEGITMFAFCFPWSYTEQQEYLALLDTRFSSTEHLEKHIDGDNCNSVPDSAHQERFSENYSHTSSSSKSISLGLQLHSPEAIYYHRELLCYSLDRLRIDLLTITDHYGIKNERDSFFDHLLFPNRNEPRCQTFKKKKVFVVTSRVHPGETPASHVFNGFLEFILREKDPRAITLRRQYIFKLVPMLNPDGVMRGHYRTDSRGVNLNRVYVDPDFDRFPSIYAVKSLLVHHHVNQRLRREEGSLRNCARALARSLGKNIVNTKRANPVATPPKPGPPGMRNQLRIRNKLNMSQTKGTSRGGDGKYAPSTNTNSTCSHPCFPETSEFISPAPDPVMQEAEIASQKEIQALHSRISTSFENPIKITIPFYDCSTKPLTTCDTKSKDTLNRVGGPSNAGSDGSDCEDEVGDSIFLDDPPSPSLLKSPHLCHPDLLKIGSSGSGIALYIDLHGHCSKRGCFLYGNHLPREDDMVENVLFARLFSCNSAHLDWGGCNFTAKNMVSKDRRDGLSKAGAGRVAIGRHLGIIHSYTLECNYNTGRIVNHLSMPIDPNHCVSPPLPSMMPPKYTPDHFAEVGRGMAITALDLTDTNPWSRLPTCYLKTLTHAKEVVRRQLRSNRGPTRVFYRPPISSICPLSSRHQVGPSTSFGGRIIRPSVIGGPSSIGDFQKSNNKSNSVLFLTSCKRRT